MDFRIGFPIDAGEKDLSFVTITRVVVANSHFCTGGQGSGLRENSGAAYVFRRALPEIQQKCRYEFTPIPMPNSKTRPDNLCDVGYSDSAACALAITQYHRQGRSYEVPLLLISCAFVAQPQQYGLKKIMLEKVTGNDREEARESLLNKWHAACKNNARALVLHCDDAQILSEALSTKSISVAEVNFNEASAVPHLVSCETHQWSLLLTKLTKPRSPFVKWRTILVLIFVLTTLLFYGSTFSANSLQKSIVEIAQTVTMADVYKEGKGKSRQRIRRYVSDSNIPLANYRPTLLENLNHEDWRVRIVSVYLIGEMQEKRFAEERLLQFLVEDTFVGFVASSILNELQPHLRNVLPLLDKLDNSNQRFILEVMKNTTFETDIATYLALEKYLRHDNRSVVATVLHLLKHFPTLPDAAIPLLFAKLQSSSINVSNLGMLCLMLSPNSTTHVIAELKNNRKNRRALLKILHNKPRQEIDIKTMEYLLHSFAIDKLQFKNMKRDIFLKVPPRQFLPLLLRNLQTTNNRYVKQGIMHILSYVNDVPRLPKLVPTIAKLLTHHDINVTTYQILIRCIEKVGVEATTKVRPILLQLLTRKGDVLYDRVRREILGCLAKMGRVPQSTLDYTLLLLKDAHFYHQQIIDLWRVNASPQLVRSLEQILPHLLTNEQAVVILALGEMKEGSKTLQSLVQGSVSSYIKILAMEALAKIDGGLNKEYKELLIKMVEDKNPKTQYVCLRILQRLHMKQALPLVQSLQQHRNAHVRAQAYITLAKITNDTQPLLTAFDDASDVVRYAVLEELAMNGNALAFLRDILQKFDKPQDILPMILQSGNYSLSHIELLVRSDEELKEIAINALPKFVEKSLPFIENLLKEEQSMDILRAIVKVLKNVSSPRSCKLLQIILEKEPSLELEAEVRRALREMKCE
ncbi:HEAT repeat domain-containing protein [Candidatus Uabimicrobium amorphum]|uniref:HEAT repeat domain-containing protein n=1 Tax=Uabimicrobium amorphum TaxID=2596890 RepID=A0A5S9IJL1_UABAM|nr:HEAT repeat domain-containing protein [Candidatus Uabimicrobium amorphum]BBM83058.1 hypothetical protein UABAM_01408 [Candidatus Uabimicrobium amorphum]